MVSRSKCNVPLHLRFAEGARQVVPSRGATEFEIFRVKSCDERKRLREEQRNYGDNLPS